MLPWNNSWFQLSLFAALFSAGVLAWDFKGSIPPLQTASTQPSSPSDVPNNPANSGSPATAPSTSTTPIPDLPSPPQGDIPWQNSLGMQFKPAGTPGTIFCIWDTRVKDFQQFTKATDRSSTADVYSWSRAGWTEAGNSWSDPGYPQGDNWPVVGVSWDDAQAFCNWLTQKERDAHVLNPNQYYRMPLDAEWTAAAGATAYPWGDTWPPDPTDGNYQRQGDGLPSRSKLEGTDGYAYASPVGNYAANSYGLFDMGGNAWQWIEDSYRREMTPEKIRQVVRTLDDDGGGNKYKTARGASCYDSFDLALLSGAHERVASNSRRTDFTFRCVLVVAP